MSSGTGGKAHYRSGGTTHNLGIAVHPFLLKQDLLLPRGLKTHGRRASNVGLPHFLAQSNHDRHLSFIMISKGMHRQDGHSQANLDRCDLLPLFLSKKVMPLTSRDSYHNLLILSVIFLQLGSRLGNILHL